MRRVARRVPLWSVFGAVGLALTGGSSLVDAAADDTAYPITVDGSGDSDIAGELVAWQNTLFASDQPVDFQYFQPGSREGRWQLLNGLSDFTVTGVPFTDEELASRPAGAGEILDVPMSVGSISIMIADPAFVGWRWETESPCDLDDPSVDPDSPECAVQSGVLTTPIKIPPENLGAMIVGLPPDFGGLSTWAHPDVEAALGTSDLVIQNIAVAHPTFLNRTEATSGSKALQVYTKAMAPTAWDDIQIADPGFAWEPVGESFSPRTPSRYGLDTQLGLMSLSNTDPITNSSPFSWTGNMGPVPTTLVPKLLAENPDDHYQIVVLQNANGDWVTPTRESLDAALAAGTDMDHAATHAVPGAYPLVYINRLYTIAGTLEPDEANALAAAIRYIVTDGQQVSIDLGSTSLPDALVTEALAGADEIVAKNCTAEGYEVTTSGPSAFEADTPGVQSIAAMKHCTLAPPPSTTTEAATTTIASTTTTAPPSTTTAAPTTAAPVATAYVPPIVASQAPVYTSPPVYVGATPTTSPPESTVTATTDAAESTTTTELVASEPPVTTAAGGGGSRPRGVALTSLPLGRPDDGAEQFKKLGTLMMGASLFLLGRRLVQARRIAA
jgi:ABC-type phosphate transport system substrate-binding protein